MDYVAPLVGNSAFNCPHCGAFSEQKWSGLNFQTGGGNYGMQHFLCSKCGRCSKYALWVDGLLIYPPISTAPLPLKDMPPDVRETYLEASRVADLSPRAACALLRLAVQQLMVHLGEKGKNINDDIGSLVKKGLREKLQKSLDVVRVVGNNAVHPGQINVKDSPEIAYALFRLVNMIVQEMITEPAEIDALFNQLPANAIDQIKDRDGTS